MTLRVCQGVALRGVSFTILFIPTFGVASTKDIGRLQVVRGTQGRAGDFVSVPFQKILYWFGRLFGCEVCIFKFRGFLMLCV